MNDNRSMPAAAIIPELNYPDVAVAADWLCKAFGFSVRLRIGDHRIQLVRDSAAVIARQGPVAPGAAAAHALMVRIADVDAHHAHASRAGAEVSAPQTFPYGERQYSARDPAGHIWIFSQTVQDVDPASWGGILAGS
jgi:uncharacterized glyoxalase superfamily protein PhnB